MFVSALVQAWACRQAASSARSQAHGAVSFECCYCILAGRGSDKSLCCLELLVPV